MAQLTLLVPAPLVGALRETVVSLYRATAEALHLSMRAGGEGTSLNEVHQHRVRLASDEDWRGTVRAEAVQVTAQEVIGLDRRLGAIGSADYGR